jgi:RNA polymerase primary sigma factor
MDEDEARAYLQTAAAQPLLSREEEIALCRAFRQGDLAARERLERVNMRLVVSIARRYLDQGLPFGELLTLGDRGLQRAIEEYDLDRGFKLSSYATWWIRQAITRGIAETGRSAR